MRLHPSLIETMAKQSLVHFRPEVSSLVSRLYFITRTISRRQPAAVSCLANEVEERQVIRISRS